jgi:hypothetical protein
MMPCSLKGGQQLAWAGDMGCADDTKDTKAKCDALGAPFVWKTKAESKAQCDAHGSHCKSKHQEWMSYDGVTTASACTSCGDERVWKKRVHWDQGIWQDVGVWQGTWKAREWVSLNTWETGIVHYKMYEYGKRAVSRLVSQVMSSQLACNLEPMIRSVPVVGCGCASGSDPLCVKSSYISVLQQKNTLFCNDMANMAKFASPVGEVTYLPGSTCTNAVGGSQEETISKGAVTAAAGRRLGSLPRRLSACAAHAVIKNSNGGICGQKMGAALSTTAVGVQLCIQVTVPASEVCSDYTVMDFAVVETDGTITPPLSYTVTLDSTGTKYCCTTTRAGMHIPVKRLANVAAGGSATTGSTSDAFHAKQISFVGMLALGFAVHL